LQHFLLIADLDEQTSIIEEYMLEYIEFTQKHNLLMTGGSACYHQRTVVMSTLDIPDSVAD